MAPSIGSASLVRQQPAEPPVPPASAQSWKNFCRPRQTLPGTEKIYLFKELYI